MFFPPDKRLITDSVFFAKESYFRGDNSTDYRSLLGFVSSVFRERERERETETETETETERHRDIERQRQKQRQRQRETHY